MSGDVPEGCAPGAYRLFRAYFIANFCDGEEGGVITMDTSAMADEVAEMFSCEHWRETWNKALLASLSPEGRTEEGT